jgi:hypothetical protein
MLLSVLTIDNTLCFAADILLPLVHQLKSDDKFQVPDTTQIHLATKCDDIKNTALLENCLLDTARRRDRCQDAPCVHDLGVGIVYFKHQHKAGGTTMRSALRETFCPYSKDFKCGGKIGGVVNEMAPLKLSMFPKEMINEGKVPPWLLLAVNIREPISRVISLFEFEGFCGHRGYITFDGKECKNNIDPLTMREFIDIYQAEALKIEELGPNKQPTYYTVSVSNYMVQMLRGKLTSNVTEADYHEAIKRLSLFHNIFVTEQLSSEQGLLQFSDIVRLPNTTVAHLNQSCEVVAKYKPPIKLGHCNGHTDHPGKEYPYESYRDEITHLNQWDIKLYNFSLRLSSILNQRVIDNPRPICPSVSCPRTEEDYKRAVRPYFRIGFDLLHNCDV